MSDDSNTTRDSILIGKKTAMAYATLAAFQLVNLPAIYIKARGANISRAVDVAQIIYRKTKNGGHVIGDIKIGFEQLESKDGRPRNVSTIEIEIKKTA